MHHQIKVTPQDIAYVEKILLPEGSHFDHERLKFIEDFDVLDLLAVPGSGKTTALLAKLLILDKHLPFQDGSGVLVISHTNVAIEDIKARIGKYCVNLFNQPNFVGTIQAFVDKYLAAPYYANKYKKKLLYVDDGMYDRLQRFSPTAALPSFVKMYMSIGKNSDILRDCRLHSGDRLMVGIKEPVEPLKDRTRPIFKWLLGIKKGIREKGCLSFSEAYILALEYMKEYPEIKIILQNRFRYVFVDEFQDMDFAEYNLLEELFYDKSNCSSIYQRIGDQNQSIYENQKETSDWVPRAKILELNGSHRLNSYIAKAVMPFGKDYIKIVGLMKNTDGTEIDIKPHIFVYNDATRDKVIQRFAELIESLEHQAKLPVGHNKYYAVGWTNQSSSGQTHIHHYHPGYSKEIMKDKVEQAYLIDYINNIPLQNKKFDDVKKSILNSLTKVLFLEGVTDTDGRFFSQYRLIEYLSTIHPEYYDKFKELLIEWCFQLMKGKKDLAIDSLRSYIPILLNIFGVMINKSKTFIDGLSVSPTSVTQTKKVVTESNLYKYKHIDINIGTVHSVKGQTHVATLYLETNFWATGGIAYESQRLSDQFKGTPFKDARLLHIRSTKMVYVGFSRPTHLLGFAVHEDRYNLHLNNVDSNDWEVVRLV